jgi:DNA-binding protein H-NS
MSEFDEARQAAVAWIREQMERVGLTLEDLEAAGCFAAVRRTDVRQPAPASAQSAAVGNAEANGADNALQMPAVPAPVNPPSPIGVLYRNALGQTWDGTGECPDWLQRAVNAGQSMDFYRVEQGRR